MISRSSPNLFLLVLACVIRSPTASFVLRLGVVLTKSCNGTTGEMRDARLGYELFFDMTNDGPMDPKFMLLGRNGTEKFSMKYEFLWRDDDSDKDKHEEEVNGLVYNQSLTFPLGSYPNYAAHEMEISKERNLLNFQCCVGLDSFYRQDYKRVFGLYASNRRYMEASMKKLLV